MNKLNVTVVNDNLVFGESHGFALNFQRTLRIPDDGRSYPLPPGLGRQLGVIPLGGIIPDNQHLVSRFKAQRQETKGKVLDIEIIVLPGIRLPDTIVLVTHGSAMIAVFLVIVFEYLGPGITLFPVGLLHPDRHFPLDMSVDS